MNRCLYAQLAEFAQGAEHVQGAEQTQGAEHVQQAELERTRGVIMEKKNSMEELLRVGVITATHGLKGEVKVFPVTDDVKRFQKLKEIILDTGNEKQTMEIESVKFFKQLVILKFKGYDSIEMIERYKKKNLYVTRENAVRLNKDEYFIADLIGLRVIDAAGVEIGMLKDVIETGANDVYAISLLDGRELLLPAIKQCILSVDMEAGEMMVHILEGLLE